MLTDPLPYNQNMNSRNMDSRSSFGGHKNPPNAKGGHGCINMMLVANVVKHAKDYDSSRPNVGKETTPIEVTLHIDKPKGIPHISKGVL